VNKPSRPSRSPQDKKRLDYKHQMRPLEPGAASRKVRKQLPPLERKKYRRALDTIARAALRDDEAALTLAEDFRATKRAHFTYLFPRRKVSTLGAVVRRKRQGRLAAP